MLLEGSTGMYPVWSFMEIEECVVALSEGL